MDYEQIIEELRSLANPEWLTGMTRFGINPSNTLGISVAKLRKVARPILKELRRQPERRHALAAQLWASGLHEARQMAAMLDVPALVTPEQMEAWVLDLDSWDVCDAVCMDLFDETPYAFDKAQEWAANDEEFVRRAAFALMAALAFRAKPHPDEAYEPFFALIKKHATDERNFVKKAVNWALRQIGKRNDALLLRAIEVAREIEQTDSRSSRWIARDALRELLPRLGSAGSTPG
jgi:3-methyladenine DNA glycosylase AlkD